MKRYALRIENGNYIESYENNLVTTTKDKRKAMTFRFKFLAKRVQKRLSFGKIVEV